MPKIRLDQLSGRLEPEDTETLTFTYDARAPELTTALGGLGLGEVQTRGLSNVALPYEEQREAPLLDMIDNEATRAAFEHAIAAAEKLYARIELTTPTIPHLISKGVDFTHLASIYEAKEREFNTPELVLVPLEMPLVMVQRLFSRLRKDTSIPNNPLRIDGDDDGLVVAHQLKINWGYMAGLTALPNACIIAGKNEFDIWSLRIVPGSPHPPVEDVDYEGVDDQGILVSSPDHPTVVEYLMLQALRVQEGNKLVDRGDRGTWLKSEFTTGSSVNTGVCGSYKSGQVRLGLATKQNSHAGQGIRPTESFRFRA